MHSLGVQAKSKVVDVKSRCLTVRTNVKYNDEVSHSGSVAIGKKKRTWSRVVSSPKTLKDNVLVRSLFIAIYGMHKFSMYPFQYVVNWFGLYLNATNSMPYNTGIHLWRHSTAVSVRYEERCHITWRVEKEEKEYGEVCLWSMGRLLQG